MRVVKVLNNSLIMALDEDGQEVILSGKGIGYRKAIGYELKENEIQKIFVLRERTVVRDVIRLAAEVGEEYFNLTKSVISYAVETYHMKLMDHIYLSLTDHLSFAARRIREGIVLQNFYTLEMKKFNPNEFQVGEYAVSLMSEQLGMEVPMDEAGNIAFHFINAQYDHPYNSQNLLIASTVSDILDIVKYSFGITYNEDSTPYSRYVTHVQLFVQRLVSRNQLPDEKSSLLYEQISAVCQKEFECVGEIQIYVMDKFRQKLTSQERMYLALHIHRVLEEQ